jgi:hypothetical protein
MDLLPSSEMLVDLISVQEVLTYIGGCENFKSSIGETVLRDVFSALIAM